MKGERREGRSGAYSLIIEGLFFSFSLETFENNPSSMTEPPSLKIPTFKPFNVFFETPKLLTLLYATSERSGRDVGSNSSCCDVEFIVCRGCEIELDGERLE